MGKLELSGLFDLHDDASNREKLTVMTKWYALMDDERNPGDDWCDRIDAILELGKSYRLTIIVEELPPEN